MIDEERMGNGGGVVVVVVVDLRPLQRQVKGGQQSRLKSPTVRLYSLTTRIAAGLTQKAYKSRQRGGKWEDKEHQRRGASVVIGNHMEVRLRKILLILGKGLVRVDLLSLINHGSTSPSYISAPIEAPTYAAQPVAGGPDALLGYDDSSAPPSIFVPSQGIDDELPNHFKINNQLVKVQAMPSDLQAHLVLLGPFHRLREEVRTFNGKADIPWSLTRDGQSSFNELFIVLNNELLG